MVSWMLMAGLMADMIKLILNICRPMVPVTSTSFIVFRLD